jgi:hypothetical protein
MRVMELLEALTGIEEGKARTSQEHFIGGADHISFEGVDIETPTGNRLGTHLPMYLYITPTYVSIYIYRLGRFGGCTQSISLLFHTPLTVRLSLLLSFTPDSQFMCVALRVYPCSEWPDFPLTERRQSSSYWPQRKW